MLDHALARAIDSIKESNEIRQHKQSGISETVDMV